MNNGRIALRKYRSFNITAHLAIAGGIAILAAAPLLRLWNL